MRAHSPLYSSYIVYNPNPPHLQIHYQGNRYFLSLNTRCGNLGYKYHTRLAHHLPHDALRTSYTNLLPPPSSGQLDFVQQPTPFPY
jgi:hypothetical protein